MTKQARACAILACLLSQSIPVQAYDLDSEPGTKAVNFNTTRGLVQVNFPDDIAAGDTVSGTILLDPKGSSEREQSRSEEELNKYVLLIDNVESSVGGGEFTIKVPANATTIEVQLKSKTHVVGTPQQLPVLAKSTAHYSNYQLAGVSQAGRTLQVYGDFDGNFGTTNVIVNGKRLDKLAESPRKLVVSLPQTTKGLVGVELTERNRTMLAKCPVLAIEMTQPNAFLAKNKETTVTINVSGTSALQKPVEVVLKNFSPEAVELIGGNSQRLPIPPNQFDTSQFARNVKGLKPGQLRLAADVFWNDYIVMAEPGAAASVPVAPAVSTADPNAATASQAASMVASASGATSDASSANQVCGTWQSGFGPVTITKAGPIDGDKVSITGFWEQSPDKRGIIRSGAYRLGSKTLEFDYYQQWNDQTGQAKFSLSDDGKTFKGTFSQPTASGEWVLNRQ